MKNWNINIFAWLQPPASCARFTWIIIHNNLYKGQSWAFFPDWEQDSGAEVSASAHGTHTHSHTSQTFHIEKWISKPLMKKTEKAKTFLARKFFKGMCTQTQSDYYLNFSTQILLFFSLCISLSLTRRENNGIINYLYYKNKIRWARTRREKKIMIDNLELSLLLVMKRNFYWWWWVGERKSH